MPDDPLCHPGAFDHLPQIDTGFYSHLMAHEDEVFSTNVAGRSPVSGEGHPPRPPQAVSNDTTLSCGIMHHRDFGSGLSL